MRFDRYIRFYDRTDELLEYGKAWGVYAYPDGQNQIWFARRDEVDKGTVCMNHPSIVDLISQIPDAIGHISLFVTYLYGARSDKSSSGTRTVCNLAAKMRRMLREVAGSRDLKILAPHDENTDASNFSASLEVGSFDGFIYPDLSAKSRMNWLPKEGKEEIFFEKQRDQETGDIIGYRPQAMPQGSRYLVVDDLCDGGATFVKIAEALPEYSLDLAIVHGVFSGDALDRLFAAGYGNIWTTNSYVQHDADLESNINERCTVQNVW